MPERIIPLPNVPDRLMNKGTLDTALEPSGTPVDELDGSLGIDGGKGGVEILGHDITSVHEAAGHVIP